MRELEGKLSPTLVDMPRPIGTAIIRGKTGAEVMRKLQRRQRAGYIAAASPLTVVSKARGGGFAVKVTLLKPLPEPVPGWAKGVAVVGTVMMCLGVVSVFVLNALAAMFAAAAAIPWAVVIGGGIVAVVVAGLVIRLLRGGSGVHISQNIHL